MPKRTNAFQELTAIIHTKLTKGWAVTESMLLQDKITGGLREVDVVAKATVANYDLYISVECRDHTRPADVTWIECMSKKHESLPTSKLILWSKSGFTKQAITKAAALKIDTVSQASICNIDWALFARDLIGSHVQLVTPKYTPFIDVHELGKEAARLENVSNSLIFDANGNTIQSIPAVLEFLAKSPDIANTLLDHAPTGSGDFYAELCPPVAWFVNNPEGRLVPILRIGIGVSTIGEKLTLDTASASFDNDNKVATLATAKTTNGRFQLYVEESSDGSKPLVTATIQTK